MRNDPIEVVFCCDRHMLPGLHVSIHSMLSSYASGRPIRITWLHEDISQEEIDKINATIGKHKHNVLLNCIDHKTLRFKDSSALHGSRFPYARLDIPSLLSADKAIYLDSDLIVNVDISELFDTAIDGWILGVPYLDGIVENSLDRDLLVNELGIPSNSPYFNSGVLLLNLRQWREQDIDSKIDLFLKSHGDRCKTCDQTVLNALFHHNFKHLSKNLNQELVPTEQHPISLDGGIFHFVGRPKPWDVGGRHTNPHSDFWFSVLAETSIGRWSTKIGQRTWVSLRASWRSSIRTILKNLITVRKPH